MRIFFLLLQAFILMTLGAAVASLLNEFALHIGGATSQALILLCLLADGGVLFSGPFVALAAAMFIFCCSRATVCCAGRAGSAPSLISA